MDPAKDRGSEGSNPSGGIEAMYQNRNMDRIQGAGFAGSNPAMVT